MNDNPVHTGLFAPPVALALVSRNGRRTAAMEPIAPAQARPIFEPIGGHGQLKGNLSTSLRRFS